MWRAITSYNIKCTPGGATIIARHVTVKDNSKMQLYMKFTSGTCRNFITNSLYRHNMLLVWICVLQFKINFHFRRLKDGRLFEELALIRELGAYSRGGRVLDITVSRVGTYTREKLNRGRRLIEALRYPILVPSRTFASHTAHFSILHLLFNREESQHLW